MRVRERGKKRKEYDLRPLILDLQLNDDGENPVITYAPVPGACQNGASR